MKAVVLAGGFATRLYPVTEFTPKPLLPVVGKPIINYIIEKLELIDEVDEIYVSTNQRFEKHFQNWLSRFDPKNKIKLVVEATSDEREKMGAVGSLKYLIEKENIRTDLMVVAGDNLFDFDLNDFFDYYKEKKAPVVAFYDLKSTEDARRFGVASVDINQKVIDFEEKPENPKSTLASTCCYIFPENSLELLKKYINDKNNPDHPGSFIKWLSEKDSVFGFTFDGRWFDIGHMDAYKQANREYENTLF
jgi:glucose-1-phosphate thymidylyltransferase